MTPILKSTLPLIISGPSGVGKGTLTNLLFTRHPSTFAFSVSHTTRAARPGEVDGSQYHFVTRTQFEDLLAAGGFIEHTEYNGRYYGTSEATIEEQRAKGKVVVLDIEMDGVMQIKAKRIEARFVFVAPPSFETLEQRLRGRATDSDEAIAKRLERGRKELEAAKQEGLFDRVIVNDDLERAYKELEDFVLGS